MQQQHLKKKHSAATAFTATDLTESAFKTTAPTSTASEATALKSKTHYLTH